MDQVTSIGDAVTGIVETVVEEVIVGDRAEVTEFASNVTCRTTLLEIVL